MRVKTAVKGIKAGVLTSFMAGLAMVAMSASLRAQAPPPPVAAGWLGVAVDEVMPNEVKQLRLPADRGVVVREVQDGSPAAKGGLQKNDVVMEFNGQHVEGELQFQRFVRETPPGRTVRLS